MQVSLHEFRKALSDEAHHTQRITSVAQPLSSRDFDCSNNPDKPTKLDWHSVSVCEQAGKALEKAPPPAVAVEQVGTSGAADEAAGAAATAGDAAAASPAKGGGSASRPGHIKLYVDDGQGRCAFSQRMAAPISKLLQKFCDKRSIDILDVTFTFNGKTVQEGLTPAELGIAECDTIVCIPDSSAAQMNAAPPPASVAGAAGINFSFPPLAPPAASATAAAAANCSAAGTFAPSLAGAPSPFASTASGAPPFSFSVPSPPPTRDSGGRARGKASRPSLPLPPPRGGGRGRGKAVVFGAPAVSPALPPATSSFSFGAATTVPDAGSKLVSTVTSLVSTDEFPIGCRVQIRSTATAMDGKCARVVNFSEASGHYLCEVGGDGRVQEDHFRAQNLVRLHGAPSNACMLRPHQRAKDACERTCWRVGVLVALRQDGDTAAAACSGAVPAVSGPAGSVLGSGSSSHGGLAAGRGPRSVGCIKSVNLADKKIEVVVVQGRETLLSQEKAQVGQSVRLSSTYWGLGSDAAKGFLRPGATGKVAQLSDKLVLVKSLHGNECFWYSPEALAFSDDLTKPAGTFRFAASTSLSSFGSASKPAVASSAPSRPPVGCKVRLTASYKKVEDAELGPLKPGDVGKLLADDKGDTPFQVEDSAGTIWWYKEGAIEQVPDDKPALPFGGGASNAAAAAASAATIFTCDMRDLRVVFHDDVESLPKVGEAEALREWSTCLLLEREQPHKAQDCSADVQGAAAAPSATRTPPPALLENSATALKHFAGATSLVWGQAEADLEDDTSAPVLFESDETQVTSLLKALSQGLSSAAPMSAAPMSAAPGLAALRTEDSTTFYALEFYDVITNFDDFASWRDRAGALKRGRGR